MTDNKINIDELYKNNFQDHKIESTPENLSIYNKMLNKFNFFKFGISSFNIYYTILIALAITTGSAIYFNSETSKNEVLDEKIENTKLNNNVNNIDSNTEKPLLNTPENKEIKNSNINTHSNKETAPVDEDILNNSEEDTDHLNKKSIETPEEDDIHMDTTIVVVHDTVLVKKKIVITDTVKTVIQKNLKNQRKKKK